METETVTPAVTPTANQKLSDQDLRDLKEKIALLAADASTRGYFTEHAFKDADYLKTMKSLHDLSQELAVQLFENNKDYETWQKGGFDPTVFSPGCPGYMVI
jgi:hypothetical protein